MIVKRKKKAAPKKRAASESGSGGDDDSEAEVPSDGGGSDYEPDEPVKISKGRKSAVNKKAKKKRKSTGGGKANGYTAPVKLSAELADIVGGEEMPRHEVVKRMWAYIKENNLQV